MVEVWVTISRGRIGVAGEGVEGDGIRVRRWRMLSASTPGGVKGRAGMVAGEFLRCGALLTLECGLFYFVVGRRARKVCMCMQS